MFGKINKFIKALLAITLAVFFLFGVINFEQKDAMAAESDAIAVRVLPNPHHNSPLAWYQSQKFSGEPTPLTVDGYDAVQDGRTVYVNVANVTPGNCYRIGGACNSDADCGTRPCLGQSLYTNIYLISYNQNAAPETISIFNKVLSKWKFNTNLLAENGTCFNQTDTSQVCLADSDCTGSGLCGSLKARITRDTRRLADIIGLKMQIQKYAQSKGHFPLLSAGTYVTGKTVSTWPSWNGELATELGSSVPADPVNKLGNCGGSQYDPVTCWDDKTKSFPTFSTPDGLPPDSRIYAYSTDAQGKNYTACAEMESGLLVGDDQGACLGSFSETPAPTISCGSLIGVQGQPFTGYLTVTGAQDAPMLISIPNLPASFNIITDSNAPIYSNDSQCQTYFSNIVKAIVQARKNSGQLLSQITGSTWSAGPCYPNAYPPGNASLCDAHRLANMRTFGFTSADFGGASYVFDENEGERGQDIKDYCVPDTIILNNCPGNVECSNATINCGTANVPFFNTKCNNVASSNTIISKATLVSSNAPAGTYPITITVTNSSGGKATQNCTINVSSNAFIVSPVFDQRVVVSKTLNFSIYAASSKKDYKNMSFSFTGTDGLSCSAITPTTDGRVRCDVHYSSQSTFDPTVITVSASDGNAADVFTSQTFKLEVYNNPPVIAPLTCAKTVRVGQKYSCTVKASDPDGQSVLFSQTLDVPGLGLNSLESPALYSGVPTTAKVDPYTVEFAANDPFGAVTSLSYPLQVNNYCGDGLKESPNTEGTGGPGGQGYESCDCGAKGGNEAYLDAKGNIDYKKCVAANCPNGVCFSQSDTNAITGVPATSQANISWQYGCNTSCSSAGGGFCGDNLVQDGNYNPFKSTLGKQTLLGGAISIHDKNNVDYGEQCDFNRDTNCCASGTGGNCQWKNSAADFVSTSLPDDAALINGQSMHINLPDCRGVSNGTFDASLYYNVDTDKKGPAIVFATDLSGSSYANVPTDYQKALTKIIEDLYATSNVKKANIHVGAFGFGNCTGGPVCNLSQFPPGSSVNIANLKNFTPNAGGATNDGEGQLNEQTLLSSIGVSNGSGGFIGGYQNYKDISNPSHGSGASAALAKAKQMLDDYSDANPDERYIIILSDGFQPQEGVAEAAAAKADMIDGVAHPIKIYAINYSKQITIKSTGAPLVYSNSTDCSLASKPALCAASLGMCQKSSDNGNNCYPADQSGYSYIRSKDTGSEVAEIEKIYNQIVAKILTPSIPNIYFSIGGFNNQRIDTNYTLNNDSFNSVRFSLPGVTCDISGAKSCNPNTVDLSVGIVGNGVGAIRFSNFNLNVLPLCEQ